MRYSVFKRRIVQPTRLLVRTGTASNRFLRYRAGYHMATTNLNCPSLPNVFVCESGFEMSALIARTCRKTKGCFDVAMVYMLCTSVAKGQKRIMLYLAILTHRASRRPEGYEIKPAIEAPIEAIEERALVNWLNMWRTRARSRSCSPDSTTVPYLLDSVVFESFFPQHLSNSKCLQVKCTPITRASASSYH